MIERPLARPSGKSSARWVGVIGVLVAAPLLAGCAGALDPGLAAEASGSGGSGTGGANPTGGATGTGGVPANCTGGNEGSMIITLNCAYSGCHIAGPGSADSSGGLDLTVNATIGSRLVGVAAGTAAEASLCTGMGPYLNPGSNPPTGLLIEKITGTPPPCGVQMPWTQGPISTSPLTSTQVTCVEAWAEGLITAAAQ
jgi:hypothetical protein